MLRQSVQIFQTNPPIVKNISIVYIRELNEASNRMSVDSKRQYFYSNGVDYDMVEKYYDKVTSLNNAYEDHKGPFFLLKQKFEKHFR
jgi:hypothetical protein